MGKRRPVRRQDRRRVVGAGGKTAGKVFEFVLMVTDYCSNLSKSSRDTQCEAGGHQYPNAIPSLRGSEAPVSVPFSQSISTA